MTPPTYVKFNAMVTIGTHARDHWSADAGLGGPSADGKIVVEQQALGLMFTYDAGPLHQEILVPWSNIAHMTTARKGTPGAAAAPEQGKKK